MELGNELGSSEVLFIPKNLVRKNDKSQSVRPNCLPRRCRFRGPRQVADSQRRFASVSSGRVQESKIKHWVTHFMSRKRTAKNTLLATIEEARSPLYLLDARNRIVFANRALANWLGVPADELEGIECIVSATPLSKPIPNAVRGLARTQDSDSAFDQIVFSTASPKKWASRNACFLPVNLLADSSSESEIAEKLWLVAVDELDQDALQKETGRNDSTTEIRTQLAQLLQSQFSSVPPFVTLGKSVEARKLRRQLSLAVRASAQALIVGPAGIGTESLARFIFRESNPEASIESLMPINCAIADQAVIQETVRRMSRPVARNDNQEARWLLLLDVHLLENAAQMELEGFLRLPGNRIKTISTSRVPLFDDKTEAIFLSQLASRISDVEIDLLPLEKRAEDFEMILLAVLESSAKELGVVVPKVSIATIEWLLEYAWPGNLSELIDVVDFALRQLKPLDEKITRVSQKYELLPEHFPDRVRIAIRHGRFERPADIEVDLTERLAVIEREYIERALVNAKYNKSKAAKSLKMNRAKFLRRCEQLNVSFPDQPVEFVVDHESILFTEEGESQ